MKYKIPDKVKALIHKGVKIPNPLTVDIGEEVRDERISSKGVTIFSGCKIYGEKTLIMSGTKIGHEAPVTLEDCQLGSDVELKGGFFSRSVFLNKANMGSGAHVREACILEEEANGAHTVGLKQTILFPFVTLGSLINFCDCLMAGGTSRKDHSEVGSSYIHFNYTPNQDKATPSLIGDVPRGVMLNQRPIFLGGQGGLVGPVRIGYGTVIAAGTIFRKDVPEGQKLLFERASARRNLPFSPGTYRYVNIRRIVFNNINYISNLMALKQWYLRIRAQFFSDDILEQGLFLGALEKLDMAVRERIKRLSEWAMRLSESVSDVRTTGSSPTNQKRELRERWPEVEEVLENASGKAGDLSLGERFMEIIAQRIQEQGDDYVTIIQSLDDRSVLTGTKWLQGLVDEINKDVMVRLPNIFGSA